MSSPRQNTGIQADLASGSVRRNATLLQGRAVLAEDELAGSGSEGRESGDGEVLVVEGLVVGDQDLGLYEIGNGSIKSQHRSATCSDEI